jgi:hypothetical protein
MKRKPATAKTLTPAAIARKAASMPWKEYARVDLFFYETAIITLRARGYSYGEIAAWLPSPASSPMWGCRNWRGSNSVGGGRLTATPIRNAFRSLRNWKNLARRYLPHWLPQIPGKRVQTQVMLSKAISLRKTQK